MITKKVKNILLGLLGSAVIVGGIVINMNGNEPLTWPEYQTLISVYQHEVDVSGGRIDVLNVDNPIIRDLNSKILARPVTEGSVTIQGETLTAEEYRQLRDALIIKSQKAYAVSDQ